MNAPHSTSSLMSSHSSLQLRLCNLFIFSIPILFSLILFLLFYLFYFKRTPNIGSTSPHPTLPLSSNQSPFTSSSEVVSKGKFKNKLEIVLFNEDLQTKDPTCCVCLGEFKCCEELYRIVKCKHVFHVDCICYWIHSNPTCPLCRCVIIADTKSSCLSLPIYGPPIPRRQVGNHNSFLSVSSELALL